MSRKVVLYQLLSLDGVAEEPGDWISDSGPEVFANLGRVIESQDDVLLGRGTYGQRLFADDDALDRLELMDSEPSPAGSLFLHYRRT